MYPGPAAPDLGVFVADLASALEERGHEFAYAVIDGRGLATKYLRLGRDAVREARRFRPEVVYSHFLFPAGSSGRGGARPAPASSSRPTGRTSATSGRSRLLHGDLDRHAPRAGRRRLGLPPARYCRRLPALDGRIWRIGLRRRPRTLPGSRRRGAEGEARLGRRAALLRARRLAGRAQEPGTSRRGSSAASSEAASRSSATGRCARRARGWPSVRVVGRVSHEEVADWIGAADVVCQPSLVEAFGQALLEGLASERSVVATLSGDRPSSSRPRPACSST